MRFTSVIPRLITTMLAAAAAARGSAPASTSTTWTMPATTATSRFARAGPRARPGRTGRARRAVADRHAPQQRERDGARGGAHRPADARATHTLEHARGDEAPHA